MDLVKPRYQVIQFSRPVMFVCPICVERLRTGKFIVLLLDPDDLIKGFVAEERTCGNASYFPPAVFSVANFAQGYAYSLNRHDPATVIIGTAESLGMMLRQFGSEINDLQAMINIAGAGEIPILDVKENYNKQKSRPFE